MNFLCRVVIIFAATVAASLAASIGRRFMKNGDLAIYNGRLTDETLPWNPDYANPLSAAFSQEKANYETAIKTALITKNSTFYNDVQVSVTEFSGQRIDANQTATTVVFVLGLANGQPAASDVEDDLAKGSQAAGFVWQNIAIEDAGLPPLPEPDRSPGWTAAAQMFLSNINTSVDPCQDFYSFSCDNYIARHPAATESAMGNLQRIVFYNLTKAFETLGTSSTETSATINLTNLIYEACNAVTNESYPGPQIVLDIANEYGGWPIVDPTWNIEKVPENIYWTIGDMFTKYSVATLFTPDVDVDVLDVQRNILYLDQATLAIPASYYTSPNLTQQYQDVLRTAIYQTVRVISKEIDNATLLPQIDRMVAIEYHLAMISVSANDERNMSLGYNPYTVSQAQSEFPAFNWTSFFNGLLHSIYPQDDPAVLLNPFIIEEPRRYAHDLDTFLADANANPDTLRDLVNYLIFRLISPYMQFASDELSQIYKQLRQQIQLEEVHSIGQELGCVQYLAQNLPFATGRLYVDSTFPQVIRDDIAVMINNVLSAFSSSLNGLQWMDNESALKSYQKIAGLVRNVAYPDWEQDDTELDAYHQQLIDETKDIDPKDPQAFYKYVTQVEVFQQQVLFQRLKQPANRADFGASPTIVDAWYQPSRNSITFTAAIMNPPFYRYDFPEAVNYGSMGVVMGHELSHGFDDEGVQFDWDGSLHTWMTPQAQSGFAEMAQCVVDEYSNFCYPEGCVNGVTTEGEDIADNGGVKAAYHAYKAYTDSHGEEKPLPGMEWFTMDQIFFMSFAQNLCGSYSPEALIQQLLTNPHSPGRDRINGAMQNFPTFGEAFRCTKGDPMYPVNPCDVW